GIASIELLRGMPRTRVHRVLAGFAIGVLPYVAQIATAGLGHAFQGMVIDPVFRLRGGRSLPIPPSWGHFDGFLQRAGALAQISWPFPALARPHELFIWFFLLLGAIAFVLWQGWRAVGAGPHPIPAPPPVLAGGLLGPGPPPAPATPAPRAPPPGAMLRVPVVADRALRVRDPAWAGRSAAPTRPRVGGGMALILAFVIPAFTIRTYADYSLQTFGIHRASYKIEHDGRVFYYGKPDRAQA